MDNPSILFEDNDLLVLDKPSGITVNKAESTKGQETVQGWVEEKYQVSSIKYQVSKNNGEGVTRLGDTKKSQQGANATDALFGGEERQDPKREEYNIEQEFYSRGGVVHRLDKETSGNLLISKNPQNFVQRKA